MEEKKQLRQQVKQEVSRLSPTERAETSVKIREQIEQLPLFTRAKAILLFHSLADEVDTHNWIERWHGVKEIYLPVVNGDNLEIKRYTPDKTRRGAFGITEPVGESLTDYSLLDLIIVPGAAFDPHRNRLGRGKGYYDRLLKKTVAPTIGVAYDCQIVREIPALPHDVPMSLIISKSKIYQ